MLILLNSIPFPMIPDVVQELAARYETGAGIDIHSLLREQPISPFHLKQIGDIVSGWKNGGHQHGVLSYTFDSPESLKDLRVYLDRYDNEIYAFRLHFSDTELQNMSDTDLLVAYCHWRKYQEIGAKTGDMGYQLTFERFDHTTIVKAIWDDVHKPVELVEYDTHWPEMFATEQQQIRNALKKLVIDIEHIGSTSIPGMTAKPIVDILLTVNELPDAWKCIDPLRALDYAFIDYPQNTTRLFFRKGKPRSHHLHIVEKGSDSDLAHIHFRDALLSNESLRQEYLQLKQDALGKFKHRRALYGERKGELIRKALKLT